ncbi:sensor domain-containing diguanylate cyclase [Halomonas sp. V046]
MTDVFSDAATASGGAVPQVMRERLTQCPALPTLPSVVTRILPLTREPDAGLLDFARVIETDPALTLKLVALANNAFYARGGGDLTTCREAVQRLGSEGTLAALLSFSLLRGRHRRDFHDVWQRTALAAQVAKILAEKLCPLHSGLLFTQALLQDIGILALSAIDAQDYSHLVASATSHADLCRQELERYGCDHAAIGAWLARCWGVPEVLAEGIAESHGDPADGIATTACLRLSGRLADAWLQGGSDRQLHQELAAISTYPNIDLDDSDVMDLAERLLERLPDMAALLAASLDVERDLTSLLADGKHQLFELTLRLQQRLQAKEQELEDLREDNAKLDAKASRDSLTGLANRDMLERHLAQLLRQAGDQDLPLSLLFIDLDRFKQLNDRHGHAVGDVVLTHFASTLTDAIRGTDLAARYGGEEFVVLLPGERPGGAHRVAERLTRWLGEKPMAHHDDQPLYITASIGISHWEPGMAPVSAAALVELADQQMYRSKRGGRARVSMQLTSSHHDTSTSESDIT